MKETTKKVFKMFRAIGKAFGVEADKLDDFALQSVFSQSVQYNIPAASSHSGISVSARYRYQYGQEKAWTVQANWPGIGSRGPKDTQAFALCLLEASRAIALAEAIVEATDLTGDELDCASTHCGDLATKIREKLDAENNDRSAEATRDLVIAGILAELNA